MTDKDFMDYIALNERLIEYHAALDYYLFKLHQKTGVDITAAQEALIVFAKAMTDITIALHPKLFGVATDAETHVMIDKLLEQMMKKAQQKRKELEDKE